MKLARPVSLFTFVSLLAFVLAIFYLPFLTGQASFYLFDITNYYEPSLKVLAENWQQGRFMLWNPYSYCGMPQIAITEPGLFYPPNWLFALTSFNAGLALSLILHQLLAGLGSFLLVISFGWGLIPASLAGLAAALCGYMFSLQTNYTLMACAAWCPFLLWLLRCIDKQSGVLRAVAIVSAALSTAMMILTGRPEIFGPALLIIGFYVVFACAWQISEGQNKVNALLVALGSLLSLGLGVLIAAPGILPAMEWLPLSPRAEGLVPSDTMFWSANWYDFLCLLLPQPLGDLYLRTSPFCNMALANPALEPYFASAFVGPILIALVVFGICDRAWKPRWFLISLLLGFMVLAAGRFTPLGEYLLYAIPGVGVLRYPVKLLFFPVLCLIILAARGLYLVIEDKVPNSVYVANLALWIFLLIAGLALCIWPMPLLASEVPNAVTFLRLKFETPLVLQAQHLIGQASMDMAAIGLLTCLVCRLKQARRIGSMAFSLVILAGVYGLFMGHAFMFSRHPAEPDYFDKQCYLERQLQAQHVDMSKLKNLGGERFITLYIAGLLQPNNLETGDAVQKTIDHYQLSRQMLGVSTHFHQHYGSSFGYLLAETADYRNLWVDVINKSHISGKKLIDREGASQKTDLPLYRFCQITSTAYALGMIDKFTFGRFSKTGLLDPKLFDLLVEDPSWNTRIYHVKEPMPHTYLSYSWRWMDSPELAADAIINAEKSGFNPWKETLLQKDQRANTPWAALPMTPQPKKESVAMPPEDMTRLPAKTVELTENSPNLMRIAVTTPATGLLVLTDHYYPGWTAYIDQQPTTILRANAVVRAVFVPRGTHTVEYRYEPRSLLVAFAISIAALIILLFVAVGQFILDRRRSKTL